MPAGGPDIGAPRTGACVAHKVAIDLFCILESLSAGLGGASAVALHASSGHWGAAHSTWRADARVSMHGGARPNTQERDCICFIMLHLPSQPRSLLSCLVSVFIPARAFAA